MTFLPFPGPDLLLPQVKDAHSVPAASHMEPSLPELLSHRVCLLPLLKLHLLSQHGFDEVGGLFTL